MTLPFETISIEQVARYPRPGMSVPGVVRFTPDSRAVTYVYSAEGNLIRSLWRFEIATGERRIIAGPPAASTSEAQLSREEELRRERARLRDLGVTSYEFAAKAARETLLIPGGGKLLAAIDGGEPAEIPGCEGALDPRLSPDGTRVAFVRGNEVWVASVPGGEPRQLTEGAGDALTNGVAEFIAAEELDRDRGFWWSPDGTWIAFIQADSRHIPEYPIVHQGTDEPEVEPHRYPFAGKSNAILRLGIVPAEGGPAQWLEAGEDDQYIARVAWRPDGVLAAQLLSRDQKASRLVAFEAAGPRVLIEERGEPWYNLSHDTRFLESGEILWSSERSGFRHLELRAATGELTRQLTSGDWMVTRVIDVDERGRWVYFNATREGPTQRHIYRVSLDGGEVEQLTTRAGVHGGALSPDGSMLLRFDSSRSFAPRVTLVEADSGAPLATLFANEGATAEELGLTPPELVTLPAADGATELHGAVYWPPDASAGERLPLVVSVYGGPHAQRVIDDWVMTVDLRAQYLARRGFAVFVLDNRGSANRGLAFEAAIHLNMGDIEVRDQAAGVRWLAGQGRIDPARVAIYGWSYGGYMTLMALARAPEVFGAGVAGAPVTHWDGYDTGYTERYMSTPQGNPEGYRVSSVMAHVEGIRAPLLIVHGMIDENVHFRHTARLMVALAAAQKPYELLAYPEERHMPREAKGLEYQERRVLEFLERALAE